MTQADWYAEHEEELAYLHEVRRVTNVAIDAIIDNRRLKQEVEELKKMYLDLHKETVKHDDIMVGHLIDGTLKGVIKEPT